MHFRISNLPASAMAHLRNIGANRNEQLAYNSDSEEQFTLYNSHIEFTHN
jgi:hypothetical protein